LQKGDLNVGGKVQSHGAEIFTGSVMTAAQKQARIDKEKL
jgi:hypothetical protein